MGLLSQPFTNGINQSLCHVLLLVHVSVHKGWERLTAHSQVSEDEINTTAKNDNMNLVLNNLVIYSLAFQVGPKVVDRWHIEPFTSSYFSQVTATDMIRWTVLLLPP